MKSKYISFIFLEVTFLAVLFLATEVLKFHLPPWWLLLMMGPATFRMARTLSFNEIAEPLRSLFTKNVPDSCGAGISVQPKGDGIQYALGSLLACPICSGQWSALGLFITWNLFPNFGTVLIALLCVGGISELQHWWAENQEWQGRAYRCVSGLISPDKES